MPSRDRVRVQRHATSQGRWILPPPNGPNDGGGGGGRQQPRGHEAGIGGRGARRSGVVRHGGVGRCQAHDHRYAAVVCIVAR